MGALYLIPSSLGNRPLIEELSPTNMGIVKGLKYFALETPKIGRNFLTGIEGFKVYEKTYFELNQNTEDSEIEEIIKVLKEGNDVGVISDAGAPGIGDMGTPLIKRTQDEGLKVVPLSGPSAIMMALMASGFNGQNFAFVGYLPKDQNERIKKVKELENDCLAKNQTQIFIETPYRAQYIYEDILNSCNDTTLLCIAKEVSNPDESILTKSIADWRKLKVNLKNTHVVFLLQSR